MEMITTYQTLHTLETTWPSLVQKLQKNNIMGHVMKIK